MVKKDEEKAREKELQELLKVAVKQPKVPVEGQETVEDWDQEKLEQVVASKSNEYNKNKRTDIVCKFFLEVVEKKQYGWFWTCPNGSTYHYRHALPHGYILKSQMKALLQEESDNKKSIEEEIENQFCWFSSSLTPKEVVMLMVLGSIFQCAQVYTTPMTTDGRELFLADASLFVDDVEAYDKYQREEKPEQKKHDDARQFMKFLHPDLGVELPEKLYGGDCRIYVPENRTSMFKNVYDTFFDEFVLAHILGWWGKAIMICNQPLLWVLSIGFELMEVRLTSFCKSCCSSFSLKKLLYIIYNE
ncbi:hypothetical protein ACS0TY_023464 [Phlomoides rotata]